MLCAGSSMRVRVMRAVIPWRGLRSLGSLRRVSPHQVADHRSNPLAGIEVVGMH